MLLLLAALASWAGEVDPACYGCQGDDCSNIGLQYLTGNLVPSLYPELELDPSGGPGQALACLERGCAQESAAACEGLFMADPLRGMEAHEEHCDAGLIWACVFLMEKGVASLEDVPATTREEPEPVPEEPEPAPEEPEPVQEEPEPEPVVVESSRSADGFLKLGVHLGGLRALSGSAGGTGAALGLAGYLAPTGSGPFVGLEVQASTASAGGGSQLLSALRISTGGERLQLSAGVGPGVHLQSGGILLHEVIEAWWQSEDSGAWLALGPRVELRHHDIEEGFDTHTLYLGGVVSVGYGDSY